MSPLSTRESIRYARHLTLAEVGVAGQERLQRARILIVGAGGLGSPAALYLAAAGVGTIGLVDFDSVHVSNLQRQILHGTTSIGRPKLESAVARLGDLNPEVTVEPYATRLTSDNALDIIGRFDLTIDGSDNFPTRYLVNDASVLVGKPYVYGSIFRFEGQLSIFGSEGAPCYRCLFPDPPAVGSIPNCAEAGVLGVLPGVIGTMQAVEAIKWILGIGDPLIGRLLMYDALTARIREVALERNRHCPVCGDRRSLTRLIDYDAFCGATGGATAALDAPGTDVSAGELHRRTREATHPVAVVDVREPWEWDLCRIPGARHLPLGQLARRLTELDPATEIVTVCHTGIRSEMARQILVAAGFRAKNLTGGVEAWAVEVDPSMPRY